MNSNMQLLQTGSLTAQLNILKDPKTRFFWVQSPIAPRYLYLLHTKQKQIKKPLKSNFLEPGALYRSLSTEIHSENPHKNRFDGRRRKQTAFLSIRTKKTFL